MDYSDYQHVLFERRDPHILWVTLNRPEVLNAANAQLHREMVEIWDTIDHDPDVYVVVVTGAGRAFSAGGDLQMVEDAYQDFEKVARILDESRDLVYNMSCAAIAAGASGLMVEVHYNPEEAVVDAQQTVTPDELKNIIDSCHRIHKLMAPRKNEN